MALIVTPAPANDNRMFPESGARAVRAEQRVEARISDPFREAPLHPAERLFFHRRKIGDESAFGEARSVPTEE